MLFWQIGLCQESFYSEWFSSDSNHLPQNSVKSITPDKYGFIWLATENGLVRYDGQKFKIFNSGNINGISSNRMMLFDGSISNDSILIFNEKEETIHISQRGATKLKGKKSYPETALVRISHNDYILYPSFRYTIRNKPFIAGGTEKSFILRNDSIYTYSKYTQTQAIQYKIKDSSQFFVVNNRLYELGENSSYIYCSQLSVKSKFSTNLQRNTRIYNNSVAGQTFAWSGNNLYYIKDIKGRLSLKLVYSGSNYESDNIVSIYYDEQNEIVFMGSTNKGLMVVKKKSFRHNETEYRHASGTDDVYYAVEKFSQNEAITSTGEIFNKDGSTKLINIGSYTDKYVLIIDNNGDIWTKEGSWLYRFRKKENYRKPTRWKLRNSITTIIKMRSGLLYVGIFSDKGTTGGYLYEIDPSASNPEPKILFRMKVAPSHITEIDNNTLWAGSWHGLYKINLSRRNIERIKGVDSTHVRNIYAPKPEEAWIGTYDNGYYLFRNGKATHLPTDRNSYLNTVHCIVEDKEGFMWITTNKGLFTAKKQDLYDYADKKTHHVYYHLYTKQAGFSNNEFNGGCNPCGIYLDNDMIFLPSMDGVVYFRPSVTKKRQPLSGIYLDEIAVDNKSYPISSPLEFERNFGRLQFFITSPYFGNLYNQNLETMLEGPVSQEWTPMTENNVSFSPLPPGEYVLKIRKLGGFGSKHIYKDFCFIVKPAFWQTTWFLIVMIILLVITIFLAFRIRIRYMKHKNLQLEKHVVLKTQQLQNTVVALRKTKDDLTKQISNHKNLIKTITHDIKSPLRFMAITGRHLYDNSSDSDEVQKENIKAMHTSSSQLYNFVDNFLKYAKETDLNGYDSDPYLLYELVNEKTAFFNQIAIASKTIMINNCHKRNITVNRQLLSIILHNLVDNALKHTQEGIIIIESSFYGKNFSISVKDSGQGMDSESFKYYTDLIDGKTEPLRKSGMGLHMIIELLAIMEGTMAIHPKENGFSTFTVTFGLNNQEP